MVAGVYRWVWIKFFLNYVAVMIATENEMVEWVFGRWWWRIYELGSGQGSGTGTLTKQQQMMMKKIFRSGFHVYLNKIGWVRSKEQDLEREGGGNGMWKSEERNRITSNQTEWRRREQKAGTKINSVFLFLVGIKNFISAPEPTFFLPDGGWAKYRRNRNEKETKRY